MALPHQAVDARWVAVAFKLVTIQVDPLREVMVTEAAGEVGARSPPHVLLFMTRLAGAASERHRGLLA